MKKVKNKKVVNRIAWKSFQANKTRNFIAIAAVILTSILFTSIFTMGIGSAEAIQQASLRQSGGDGHAVLKYITDEQFDKVKDHPSIDEIAYDRILADEVSNKEFIKRRTEFWYNNDVGLKFGYAEPTTGKKPVKENEVIADTKTLSLLGVPLTIGSPLTLELQVKGKKVTREFVLSGWWESDPGFNVGQFFSSRAYLDANINELQYTYKDNHYLSGCINAYIKFKSSSNLQEKLTKLMADSGFSQEEGDPEYVSSNVNWAYLSTNFDTDYSTVMAVGGGLLLILFTGYLIIYNIFQISVMKDIQFYGLLKTIGTTGKQIRRIIKNQAFTIALCGIPVGLFLGFFSGKLLVPLLVSNSSFGGSTVSISPNPFIFIGAAAFSFITVFISTWKPGKIAAHVSPIEAVRYTDKEQTGKKKFRNSVKAAKVSQMALANLGRNKKRTVLVVFSLSLSIILLNTVVTLSNGIDMNQFVSRFVDTDFLLAHADYFQYKYSDTKNATSEQTIQTIQNIDGFSDGGRLYYGRSEAFTAADPNLPSDYTGEVDEKNEPFVSVYGLDPLPLSRLKLLDGSIDKEKLASGNYILEGIQTDDYGKPDKAKYKIGDIVTLHCYKGTSEKVEDREYITKEYTVLGHVVINYYAATSRVHDDYVFYLPSDSYKAMVKQPAVMSYAFQIDDDKEAAAEAFLKNYTENIEPLMNYDSKFTAMSSFDGLRNTVLLVGGALGAIIGIIGILNFINSIITSIITRRKELAMLESIGMTKKQLRRMLCMEGSFYAVFTAIFSLSAGILCSLVLVNPLCNLLWFMNYRLLVWPLLISIPILFILGILIPLAAYSQTHKQSIIERLREAE